MDGRREWTGRSRGWTGELRGHFRWRLHELPFPLALRPPLSLSCPCLPLPSTVRAHHRLPSFITPFSSLFLHPFPLRLLPIHRLAPFSLSSTNPAFFFPLLHPRCNQAAKDGRCEQTFAQWRNLPITVACPGRILSPTVPPSTTPFVILFYYTRALVQIR